MRRPPPYVRIAILLAAISLLGLAMCTRGQPPATSIPTPPADAAGNTGTPMRLEEGKMGKKDTGHFSSSKAPGVMY